MRLNDELVTASLDFDEAVQSDCVEEIEFHGLSIGRINANVRFPRKAAIIASQLPPRLCRSPNGKLPDQAKSGIEVTLVTLVDELVRMMQHRFSQCVISAIG